MIKKNSLTSAFTLIELLVVITIIGILAGIALPVFNSVQVKGAQTKALAQAKQIGLSLKLCAGDNDGVYVRNGAPSTLTTDPTNSNKAFAVLFPAYLQNETIFGNKLVKGSITPDNDTSSANKTLATGENVYGYMMGLTDASNPSAPLVFDGPDAAFAYNYDPASKGSVWLGKKATVIRLDNSGSVETLDVTGASSGFVKGTPDAGGAAVNALVVGNKCNGLSTANTCLLPDLP